MRPEGSLTYWVPERLRQGFCGVGRAAQALVCASAKEGTAFRMEAVQEGAAGVESEQAALGEEAVLLLDDIMAEVEVVAEEEGLVERREEAQRAQQAVPGPGPMTPESALEELLAVQVELEPVNAQARKAFSRQREKMERRRKPQLDRRGAVIQSVPGFWANVIANHPQMSALITDEDEDMLSYMVSLEVEEEKHPVHLCKIMLFFRSNPYFQNKVITKEYLVNITEYRASHSTPIEWYPDYEVEAYRRRHHNSSLNFFNWFSDHNFAGSNKIAESPDRSYVRTCGAIPCNTTRG
ncbi:testis-specific Y-encoded protein 8-like isoform X2 [Homo sapiens]|uniref:testis-specific Y-encoded protein 8-like isoform X2 n=1 Tax=Homo sapiens TaxID=9606 RepID=UPI0023DF047F|nr:testis-specific Y-encoded protein 8-like isoform X2 [Homo sapiens]